MKVIYKYDENTNRKIAAMDAAIACYEFHYSENIRTQKQIHPMQDYIKFSLERDGQYCELLHIKNEIMNTTIPKIIIIETDNGNMRFPISK